MFTEPTTLNPTRSRLATIAVQRMHTWLRDSGIRWREMPDDAFVSIPAVVLFGTSWVDDEGREYRATADDFLSVSVAVLAWLYPTNHIGNKE